MSGFELFFLGWELVFTVEVLLTLLVGVVAGVLIGALPGLTATMSVAIFTPLTFGMTVQQAFALLLGAYCGGVYGGSMSAVVAKIPGTPSAMMTQLDGYPMGQRGEGGKAICYATVASFIGGLFSIFILVVFAPPLARIALEFSAEEYFSVALFGLSIIAYVSSGSMIKGFISGLFGVLLASVGMDPMTAYPRFTAGSADLLSGFELLPILIGVFGLANVLEIIEVQYGKPTKTFKVKKILITWKELKKVLPTIIRQSPVGVVVGAIPAAGGTIASIVSYGIEKRFSRYPEKFGTGIPEGICAPESSNNASTGGALIPLLSLGIPGDAIGAILIGALMIHGLTPGPLLFRDSPDVISSIFILKTLATIFFLFVGLGMAKLIGYVLRLPYGILVPSIMVFCVVGSFAIRNAFFDVGVLLVFGLIGFLFNKINVPVSPLVLGFILGPILESNLRRGLVLSRGNPLTFLTRPISLMFILGTVLMMVVPYFLTLLRSRKT